MVNQYTCSCSAQPITHASLMLHVLAVHCNYNYTVQHSMCCIILDEVLATRTVLIVSSLHACNYRMTLIKGHVRMHAQGESLGMGYVCFPNLPVCAYSVSSWYCHQVMIALYSTLLQSDDLHTDQQYCNMY